MSSIDDEIKFHLSKEGWYLGNSKINLVKDRLSNLGIDPDRVNITNSDELAWTRGEDINIHQCLGWVASLPQLDLLSLHEHFHIMRGDCLKRKKTSVRDNHDMEYECDRLALNHMIRSGHYNRAELYDAIALFGQVLDEGESETHPSSSNRHKRLLCQLKECGL